MTNKAKKATLKALQRWETEGGAIAEGPQQSLDRKRSGNSNQLAKHDVKEGKAAAREE
jgi:hypothetical protein